ncbi:TPA: site-specific integrase [Pseudomonas aeruginosa]|nr:site-specific integrase [Pseudomonas aeruginosa]
MLFVVVVAKSVSRALPAEEDFLPYVRQIPHEQFIDLRLTHHKLTPHILRHTGCTNMVGVFSAEVAQKYMRHKNLYTTLGYYHPAPLDAANEANAPLTLFSSFFDDED